MKPKWRLPRSQYVVALGLSSVVSLGLFAYAAWQNRSLTSSYLLWNLFLAWLPLLLALRLMSVLRHKLWSSWEALITSFVWIIFLPNSFYMVSDFIHLQDLQTGDILYSSVMFTSFIITGVMLGYSSLYLVHMQLRRRFRGRGAAFWVGVTLLICSVAIYVGRDLRWNSWDVLFNPAGLLFDMADRLQHPAAYPHMLLVIAAFFVLLASLYHLMWRATRLFAPPPHTVRNHTQSSIAPRVQL